MKTDPVIVKILHIFYAAISPILWISIGFKADPDPALQVDGFWSPKFVTCSSKQNFNFWYI